MSTEQDKLIGKHPDSDGFFSSWLIHTDDTPTATLRHRKLDADSSKRQDAIEKIVDMVLCHHISEGKIIQLEAKRRILKKYGYKDYLSSQLLLPNHDKTQKGNCAEVILAEYLVSSSGLEILVYKLHYNPNVDQSMKGDDVLLLQKDNIEEKILVGESKFQKTPNKAVVEKITDKMGVTVLPISLSFIENALREKGQRSLAKKIARLQSILHLNKTEIVNVGFIMSNINTHGHISTHGKTNNPKLIFLSLAIDDPEEFIHEIYSKAMTKLEDIEACPISQFPLEFSAELVSARIKEVLESLKTLITPLKNG